ncbi:hypothetical protein LEP1GSC195_0612 [Leptospira wolbachii serovar Codice str. CDC]|uniref:Uncharacterized protein n=1 Tax=Leptospira wolbachii serovar Codice str. CDC TaxID=1218599 RepID=R9A812_9LEPT|nr:hypothetical protein LEP1GSC195_0612 [Leptospira wolbachii serovar Codice str. CDC]
MQLLWPVYRRNLVVLCCMGFGKLVKKLLPVDSILCYTCALYGIDKV